MNLSNVLNPRLLELMEADEQGRVVILPTRAEEQRFIVERALALRLMDWQAAYIWGDSHYMMPGRATGKTLAQIIKLCLSKGCPIILDPTHRTNMDGLGLPEEYHNYRWFRDEVKRIYSQLELFQMPGLRKIYFSLNEARSDGFNPWRY